MFNIGDIVRIPGGSPAQVVDCPRPELQKESDLITVAKAVNGGEVYLDFFKADLTKVKGENAF